MSPIGTVEWYMTGAHLWV